MLILDLGIQPWCNDFLAPEQLGREERYPLEVYFCEECSLIQIGHTIPKEKMFSAHTYVSGTTATLRAHFDEVAQTVQKRFFQGPSRGARLVVDIGSNDGTQLRSYQKLGFRVLGVESAANIAGIAGKDGVPTLNRFFNQQVAEEIVREQDRASMINAAGVFFHLEELHSVCDGIRLLLAEDGVFVVQAMYLRCIVEKVSFDNIYHEHLVFYTATTLNRLLRRHELEVFDVEVSPIHGGSLIAFCSHHGRRPRSKECESLLASEARDGYNGADVYRQFARKVRQNKAELLQLLDRLKGGKKVIFGYGAPAKGNTLLNYCGIGTQYLDCLIEKNPLKFGLYSPGMHIPVVDESKAVAPDVYLALSWNFLDEFLRKEQDFIRKGGRFISPHDPGRLLPE